MRILAQLCYPVSRSITNLDQSFDEEQVKESAVPTKCWKVGSELSFPGESAAASSNTVSPFSPKSSHYHSPSTGISASERRSTSPSQWVLTSSLSEETASIVIPTTDTTWTTRAHTTQSNSGGRGNNQISVPLNDFGAIEPPDPSSEINHERLSFFLDNELGRVIPTKNPESRRPMVSGGILGGQSQESIQNLGSHEVTTFPSSTGVRDRGRDSNATRTHGFLQCPKCSKSFQQRHKLKYVYFHPNRVSTLLINMLSKHCKTHDRSFKCTEPGCAFSGCYRKDLTRHTSTCHRKGNDQVRTFCELQDCPMARRGFSRRDNYVRHIRRQHPASLEPQTP